MLTFSAVFGPTAKAVAAAERSVGRIGSGAARRAALAAAVVLLCAAGWLSGAPISFEAVPPQPGQESFRNLWNVTLHNPTPATVSVSFRVEAREARSGSVFSAGTQKIALAPGELRLTAQDITLSEVWYKKGYQALAGPGPVLPDGDYTYVITLIPRMTQAVYFLRVRVPKPAELTWPPNNAVVADSQPLFAWKPAVVPGPIGACRYNLSVVEVGRGQNAVAALSRNRPVLENRELTATVCRAPAGVFVPGRTYAWRVGVTDTAVVLTETARMQSRVSSFVSKPGADRAEARTSFTFPTAGHAVTGHASLVVESSVPDAELCVMEYALGNDSARGDWQMVGAFPKGQSGFVGMWASDSAVIGAGMNFPASALVRATVLGRRGQRGEALLPLVINPPPPPTRKGCGGCNQHPDE